MENQTRFDLNAAIENWRQELAAQPNLAPDDRRELETHLRDAIAGFQQRGLNDEESFWLARRRIGQPWQLAEEFVKASPIVIWRERAFWIVLSLAVFHLWNNLWNNVCPYLQTKEFAGPQLVIDNTHHQFVWSGPFGYYYGPLFVTLFPVVFYLLPVVGLIIIFAKGWMDWFDRAFRFLFRSRLQFGLMALASVLISYYYNNDTSLTGTFMYGSEGSSLFYFDILVANVWPLSLIVLVTWLMPTQNRKTAKRA
jgi:hypothetical protein